MGERHGYVGVYNSSKFIGKLGIKSLTENNL